MKSILILKTGELPRKVFEDLGPYERAFLNILGEEPFVIVDAQKDELPAPDWAGVIITGSPASTYDGDAWIARSEDFLRQAADRSVPLYGVCFGHQLLAQTFGGKVEKCRHGWELGTVHLTLTDDGKSDPLFADLPATFTAQMSHGDVVTELPPGAVSLARNEHSPHQSFRLGNAIWGTQFHPEFTPTIVSNLIYSLANRLPPESFPRWNACVDPLRGWLLSSVREARETQRCLENFMKIVEERLPR
ncbi:MAG: gamma-glutamyl-gamma-aminobutyrate hydrolase family protein [Deltaproteobacteria bacterium]|nr:gamma-glutamyl-gamma-aminobutyrate hydrolase family protein [Deltaproteobacteria bacterium]